jgi:hypothetical protein
VSCPAVIKVTVPGGPAVVRVTAQTAPLVVRVVLPGPAGAQGPPGPVGPPAEAYVHQQASAATTWTINHNLGYRPSVELMDTGSREIDGDIYHPTLNQTVAMFNVPVAGTARLT